MKVVQRAAQVSHSYSLKCHITLRSDTLILSECCTPTDDSTDGPTDGPNPSKTGKDKQPSKLAAIDITETVKCAGGASSRFTYFFPLEFLPGIFASRLEPRG